jgi:hypothetical protein
MSISWNEIRARAIAFSKEWENETSEDAEAKSFWDGFFHIFGVPRRRVASFESRVRHNGKTGYIDLLWKGVILIEHKSKGRDLDKAFQQAIEYFPGLRDDELPQYILVSDFSRFRLYDLEENIQHEFHLKDLVDCVHLFGFIAGYQKHTYYKEQDPVNIRAAEWMGKLHDQLKEVNYTGHALELYLVRLLFCLFADNTSIFDKNSFQDYIRTKTKEDGSDLAFHLSAIFEICDTRPDRRLKNIDESLANFPYINGKLFEERLPNAAFDSGMRQLLLDCCGLNWGRVSPAIFGSLFQSVMNPVERRNLGAHYTTEENILKLIKSLFLDELWAEFEGLKGSNIRERQFVGNTTRLTRFHQKIASLRFLDPACGCGNFLVIAYRELRLLEIAVIRELIGRQMVMNISDLVMVDVDQFYGFEVEEFPAQIAQVALWLMDHQMNMILSQEFGEYYVRLPLRKSANIIHGNALQMDWREVVDPNLITYILGNPPFVGKQYQDDRQKEELEAVFAGVRGAGVLDYVSAWFLKAAQYIQDTNISVGLVSTNSITQGEQVSVLWKQLFDTYHIHINFAHRTFQWTSEARGRAAVHCVIIGFSLKDEDPKTIFDYETPTSEPLSVRVKNINAYLVPGDNIWLNKRRTPISDSAPPMAFGSMPNDGGFLLLTTEQKEQLLARDPKAEKFVLPLLGSEELINGMERWCIWLHNVPPEDYRNLHGVMERIKQVRDKRLKSRRGQTNNLAKVPQLFGEIRQPSGPYLAFPEVSSETRYYIPLTFLPPEVIATNKLYTIQGATLYHFGVLSSAMHMSWTRTVCGRLKSDYQYSTGIVYNNFPWPSPDDKLIARIERAAQVVLEARSKFPSSTLADLYHPLTMPPELVRAHERLDHVVDIAYGGKRFKTDGERLAHLFGRYLELTK